MTFLDFFLKGSHLTDKGTLHSYIENFYNNEFTDKRYLNMNILEIGVYEGHSISLFSEWFINSKVIGIDNKIRFNWDELTNVQLIKSDGYNNDIVNYFPDKYFDYIIDDGPHTIVTQMFAIKEWSKKLKDGGTLIIEDIQNINQFKSVVENLDKELEYIDLRHVKNRYDDVLVIYRK